MSKGKIKRLILFGVAVAICMAGAVIYSLIYNGGRLVYPMDFSAYQFHFKDLPMWFGLILVWIYMGYLVFSLVQSSLLDRQSIKGRHPGRIPKLNPKLGYLGFLGFAGFGGIATYLHNGQMFPFVFFAFFGYFGFFYEGKMSNMLADERFMENKREAQRKANSLGLRLIFILLILVSMIDAVEWRNLLTIILMAGIGLIIGFVLFFQEYLLYRYDQMDMEDWTSEED